MDSREQQIFKAMLPALDTFKHLPEWKTDGTPNPYLLGFDGIDPKYLAKAVVRSLQSTMPCHNKAFPTIPEFAADARNFMGLEYDHTKRHSDAVQMLTDRHQSEEEAKTIDWEARRAFTARKMQEMPAIDSKGPVITEDQAQADYADLIQRKKDSIPVTPELMKILKRKDDE